MVEIKVFVPKDIMLEFTAADFDEYAIEADFVGEEDADGEIQTSFTGSSDSFEAMMDSEKECCRMVAEEFFDGNYVCLN